MNIYDIFKQLNIEFKEKEHEPIFTIEQAQNIKNINGTGCKNLFLTNRKKNYYLVLLEETKRANIKDIAKLVNESHLSFASEIELNNILKLKPGSVTPLGIINDKDNIVTLIIDNELKGKKILVHPNTNTKNIVLSYDDLIKFIEFEKHNYILIS